MILLYIFDYHQIKSLLKSTNVATNHSVLRYIYLIKVIYDTLISL